MDVGFIGLWMELRNVKYETSFTLYFLLRALYGVV